MDLTAFLRHVNIDPTILPVAPHDVTGLQIQRRLLDEVHSCILCGERAQQTYVLHADHDKRWLDLCAAHASGVLRANEQGYDGPVV